MNVADTCGVTAAISTLAAFAQRSMLPMWISAILATLLFVIFGCLGLIYPVLALKIVLPPSIFVTLFGLSRGLTRRRSGQPSDPSLTSGTLVRLQGRLSSLVTGR